MRNETSGIIVGGKFKCKLIFFSLARNKFTKRNVVETPYGHISNIVYWKAQDCYILVDLTNQRLVKVEQNGSCSWLSHSTKDPLLKVKKSMFMKLGENSLFLMERGGKIVYKVELKDKGRYYTTTIFRPLLRKGYSYLKDIEILDDMTVLLVKSNNNTYSIAIYDLVSNTLLSNYELLNFLPKQVILCKDKKNLVLFTQNLEGDCSKKVWWFSVEESEFKLIDIVTKTNQTQGMTLAFSSQPSLVGPVLFAIESLDEEANKLHSFYLSGNKIMSFFPGKSFDNKCSVLAFFENGKKVFSLDEEKNLKSYTLLISSA